MSLSNRSGFGEVPIESSVSSGGTPARDHAATKRTLPVTRWISRSGGLHSPTDISGHRYKECSRSRPHFRRCLMSSEDQIVVSGQSWARGTRPVFMAAFTSVAMDIVTGLWAR